MSEPTPEPRPRTRLRLPVSRQRLVEFTVVVLGVLVALGLENLVQELRFRADARDIERAFVTDLARAVRLSLERQAVKPCLRQRVRLLSDRVGVETEELPALGPVSASPWYSLPQIYRSPSRTWVTTSFDRALGSEAFKRIPAERAARYAGIFAQIKIVSDLNDSEYLAVTGIAPLGYQQSSLTSEMRADLLRQIADLDRHQALIGIGTEQISNRILTFEDVGEKVRRDVRADDLETFKATIRASYGGCADLSVFDRLNAPAKPGSPPPRG